MTPVLRILIGGDPHPSTCVPLLDHRRERVELDHGIQAARTDARGSQNGSQRNHRPFPAGRPDGGPDPARLGRKQFAALPGMDFSQAGTPSGRTQFHPDTRRLFVGRVPRVSARNARDRTLDPGRTLHHPGPIDLDRLRTCAQATQRRRHELPGDGLAPGASLDQLLLFP